MALPFAVSIPREPPRSIEVASKLAEDLGARLIVTVGDVVTYNVSRYWRIPDVGIIDGRTMRTVASNRMEPPDMVLSTRNERGTLNMDSFGVIKEAYHIAQKGRKVTIIVDGEEDLLAIPAVLEAPPQAAVLYGLYTGYLVFIPVLNEYKILMLKLLTLLDVAKC